jgi:hypothetical protein
MNNNIRYLLVDPPVPENELPYFIWTPTMPKAWTLERLAEELSPMRPQCALACIAGDLRDSYIKIMDMRDEHGKTLAVDRDLCAQACASRSADFFQADLAQRIKEQNTELEEYEEDDWKFVPWSEAEQSSLSRIYSFKDSYDAIHSDWTWATWEETENRYASNMGDLRFYLSTPP